MSDHSDFELPGLVDRPNALSALIVTIVFAYSRRGNRRRLEDHFHAFWEQVLSHLIYGQQYLFVASQMTVYHEERRHLHPNVSLQTEPGREEERRPDFTIMGVRVRNFIHGESSAQRPMFPSTFNLWNQMVYLSGTPRLFVELKRPPSRQIDNAEEFRVALGTQLAAAARDAYSQAVIAFRREDFAALQSLILIAAVGEWWQFRIVTRDEVRRKPILDSLDDGETVEYTAPMKKRGTTKSPTVENPGPPVRKPLELFHKLRGMEPLHANVEQCRPEAGFSTGYLVFGSPQSNQCFYYIHRLLQEAEPSPPELWNPPSNSEDELNLPPQGELDNW